MRSSAASESAKSLIAEAEIRADVLTGSEIIVLLQERLRCMAEISPPESRHALNLDRTAMNYDVMPKR